MKTSTDVHRLVLLTVIFLAFSFDGPAWGQTTNLAPPNSVVPQLVADRTLELTGFQEASPYQPRSDSRTDFVMAYGVDGSLAERLDRWREAGYVAQVMTGVAWGNYQDYLDGKVDGRRHWDEGQLAAGGKPIMHGATVPYMVPSIAFTAGHD